MPWKEFTDVAIIFRGNDNIQLDFYMDDLSLIEDYYIFSGTSKQAYCKFHGLIYDFQINYIHLCITQNHRFLVTLSINTTHYQEMYDSINVHVFQSVRGEVEGNMDGVISFPIHPEICGFCKEEMRIQYLLEGKYHSHFMLQL